MGQIYFFQDQPSVTAFFTTRNDGISPEPYASLNLGPFTEDAPENVLENRKRALANASLADFRSAGLQQVHGNHVQQITLANLKDMPQGEHLHMGEGDALITDQKNIVLCTLHADCLGILLYDPKHQAIGAAHAGWRGTLAGIAPLTVKAMTKAYGTRPEDLLTALTPCIQACCFETGAEVMDAFSKTYDYAARYARKVPGNKYMLDLQGLNTRQLEDAGVRWIESSPYCTCCEEELFFSYRREQGKTGRMMAAICLAKQ